MAERVTVWPKAVGLGDELTVVVVAAGLTVWVLVPVEAVKLASPL